MDGANEEESTASDKGEVSSSRKFPFITFKRGFSKTVRSIFLDGNARALSGARVWQTSGFIYSISENLSLINTISPLAVSLQVQTSFHLYLLQTKSRPTTA